MHKSRQFFWTKLMIQFRWFLLLPRRMIKRTQITFVFGLYKHRRIILVRLSFIMCLWASYKRLLYTTRIMSLGHVFISEELSDKWANSNPSSSMTDNASPVQTRASLPIQVMELMLKYEGTPASKTNICIRTIITLTEPTSNPAKASTTANW